ncbi:protein NODULATION SIGNALING PATHWAY 2-like [Euphorbia lathyris]|uniref:protein NODULATION SIGNALING PATHWAY 2-like n=1 Tax=Euphorbia lathyris TaxID=212925 RepID=UPI00331325CC
MEMKMTDLSEEILIRLTGKGSPTGSILQRLAYYLNQALDNKLQLSWKSSSSPSSSSLSSEAAMNYEIAFNAFYQILPFGRFAHFASNSVIMEALNKEEKGIIVIHIVDFDFDKGVQWPPIIQALSSTKRVFKLTIVKFEGEEGSSSKRVLYEYAKTFGVKLEIEEMGMEKLGMKMKKNERNEWLAFNCMVGLPHMRKRRSVSDVIEFLKIAKSSISSNFNQGTITFGDGIGWGKGVKLKESVSYGSIFEGQLSQFEAFLESIDTHFPHEIMREARIAIECLFLVPYICSLIDPRMWEDISRESRGLSEIGLKGLRMTEENVGEAKELVKEGESYFWVNIEGLKHNQMVLGYKGTPLIKVSSWR